MRFAAMLVIVLVAGCAVDPVLVVRDCVQGESHPCACLGLGPVGVQSCTTDDRLGACVCPDAGGSADVVAVDAPARPTDTPAVPDATPDVPEDVADAGGSQDAPQDTLSTDVVTPSADAPPTCPGVDIMRDVANCGACGNACPVWPNTTAQCLNGGCSNTCAGGFLGCDSNYRNGCEVDPLTDSRNCGACRRACAPSQTCRNGVCR